MKLNACAIMKHCVHLPAQNCSLIMSRKCLGHCRCHTKSNCVNNVYQLCMHNAFITDLSDKSARVIVMEAYGAHFLKEVARSQLLSAAQRLLPVRERRSLCGAEKTSLLVPLARAFVTNNIVKISGNIGNLTRNNVKKVGTF